MQARIIFILVFLLFFLGSVNADPPLDVSSDGHTIFSGQISYNPSLAVNFETGQPCMAYALYSGPEYHLAYSCPPFYSISPFEPRHELPAGFNPSEIVFYPSLAYNPVTKKPGIAFALTEAGMTRIFYAFKENGTWTLVPQIDSFSQAGSFTSLEFKSDGTPCIAYTSSQPPYGPNDYYIRYACLASEDPWTWNVHGNVNGSSGTLPLYHLDLAFDDNDNAYIAYASPISEKARVSKLGTGWNFTDIMTVDAYAVHEPLMSSDRGFDLVNGPDGMCLAYVDYNYHVGGGGPVDSDQLSFACENTGWTQTQTLVGPPAAPASDPHLIYHDGNPYFVAGFENAVDPAQSDYVVAAWWEPGPWGNWNVASLGSPNWIMSHNGMSAVLHGDQIWAATSYNNPFPPPLVVDLNLYGPAWAYTWSDPFVLADDEISTDGAGYFAKLYFNEGGLGRTVYTKFFAGDLSVFFAAEQAGGGWSETLLYRDPGIEFSAVDAAWDNGENVHIAYVGYFPQEIRYTYYAETGGQVNELVSPAGDTGYVGFPSIALDSQDNPCIAFILEDFSPGHPLYFSCRNGGWSTPELIDYAVGATITFPSLTFRDGVPCIAYSRHSDQAFVVRCRDQSQPLPSPTAWDNEPEFVYTDPWGRTQGGYCDLQADSSGLMVAFEGSFAECFNYEFDPTTVFASEASGWEVENVFPVFDDDFQMICPNVAKYIDLRVGSSPQVKAGFGGVDLWYSNRVAEDEWRWSWVNSPEFPWSYAISDFSGFALKDNEPHFAIQEGPALYHVYPQDADGDGTLDTEETFVSPAYISGYPVYVEGQPNVFAKMDGQRQVTFGPVSFDWDFDNQLDLSNALVTEGPNFVEVRGINQTIPGGKTVLISKAAGNAICVLDEPSARANRMSETCNGGNEVELLCPGSAGGFTCTDADDDWAVSGLDHSALKSIGFASAEGGLELCEVMAGVICDEDEACSLGYFTRADDSDRCCLGVCVSAADLAVIDVTVDDPLVFNETVTTITVTVQNIGSVPSAAFTVSLTAEEPYTLIGEQDVDSLAVGEIIELDFNFDPASFDGLIVLTAQADSEFEITEIDETNNEAPLEVFVSPREIPLEEEEEFVDLIVLNVRIDTINPVVGQEITVTADVLNAGTIASGPFTVGVVADSIFNPLLDAQAIAALDSLELVEVSFTIDTLNFTEETEIIVFVDEARSIDESDEENNTGSTPLNLRGETAEIIFQPTVQVEETMVFTVTDSTGRNLAGATITITYPFEGRIRTETITTDGSGRAEFFVPGPGIYSFTLSKPGFYASFGEFEAVGDAGWEEPVGPLEAIIILVNDVIIRPVVNAVYVIFGAAPPGGGEGGTSGGLGPTPGEGAPVGVFETLGEPLAASVNVYFLEPVETIGDWQVVILTFLGLAAAYVAFKKSSVLFTAKEKTVMEEQRELLVRALLAGVSFIIPLLVGATIRMALGILVSLIVLAAIFVAFYLFEQYKISRVTLKK